VSDAQPTTDNSATFDDAFAHIASQDQALRILRHALSHDRIAHAYLFEGPSGVGKELAAMALTRALLCQQPQRTDDCTCHNCERIRAGNHPDVRVVRPRDEGDRNLQVEYVRSEILPFTKFAPFEGEAACIIFPEADVSFPVQHAQAANALLKTLEEPRPRVTFLLLSERPDRLLPTIRSRCQRVVFRPLPGKTLEQILNARGVTEPTRSAAIALSQGRADRALALSEGDALQGLIESVLRVDAAVAARAPGDLLDVAKELADMDPVEPVLSTLSLFYRDVARCALAASPEDAETTALSFPHQRALLQTRAAELGATHAAERVAAITATLEAVERNANTEIALDSLLFGFATGDLEPLRLVVRPRRG